MSPPLSCIEVALVLGHVPWACLLLFRWLFGRRRLKMPVHRHRKPLLTAPCAGLHHRAKPEWVVKKVIYLASHLRSCRRIADTFNRWHGAEAYVGKTCVADLKRRYAAEIQALRRERKRRVPFFIPARHTWALDLTFFQSPDGLTFTVLGIIDAGSRKLLCLKALPTKCAFTILGHLFLAFAEHGLPDAIRTDNEAMFTGRLWGVTLKALAIAHRRGPPLQPWRNGRIERLFGTLKATVGKVKFAGTEALQRTLDEFRGFYNVVRPHQALAGLTPEEAWQGKTLAEVQRALAESEGQWVAALHGKFVGYHLRR